MMPFAQVTALDADALGIPVVIASLVLVAVAIGASRFLGLGVDGRIGWASIRASIQLMSVGVLLAAIADAGIGQFLAWAWIGLMVGVTIWTVRRRTGAPIPNLTAAATLAITGSVATSLVVAFGLGIFEATPINLVVVAGITIGNALPATVLAVDQIAKAADSRRGEIEAMLALGFDRVMVGRHLAPAAAKSALIPQIERTKVVGLIAIPGAMVGLLLAGADPIEAVIVQLLVVYLVLGTVAISVMAVVASSARQAVTMDLRLADWVGTESA
jgi:putative ABC transport system permease protein